MEILFRAGDWSDSGPIDTRTGVEIEFTYEGREHELGVEIFNQGFLSAPNNCFRRGISNGVANGTWNCCELNPNSQNFQKHVRYALTHAGHEFVEELLSDSNLTEDEVQAVMGWVFATRRYQRLPSEIFNSLGTALTHNNIRFEFPYMNYCLTSDPSCGLEMLAPPLDLREESHRQSILDMARAIDEAGGFADSSAGLHVHHDARDMSVKQLKRIIVWYRLFEPFLTIITLPWRIRQANYSIPWMRSNRLQGLEGVLGRWSTGNPNSSKKISEVVVDEIAGLRGHHSGLSTSSLNAHNTLELRLHEGTVEGEQILNWMLFTQRFIWAAARTKLPILTDYYPIEPTAKSIRGFMRWMRLNYSEALDPLIANLRKWYVKRISRSARNITRNFTVDYKKLEEEQVFSPVNTDMTDVFEKPAVVKHKSYDSRMELGRLQLLARHMCEEIEVTDREASELPISLKVLEDFSGEDEEHIRSCSHCMQCAAWLSESYDRLWDAYGVSESEINLEVA